MSDLVERLRAEVDREYLDRDQLNRLALEAAVELARLRTGARAEADERAAFEAWAKTEWANANFPHSAWIGWQGRAARQGAGMEGWPEPVVTNPDIADPTGVPYIDSLIHRILDAQQDISLEANERMSQPLCDASALIDEIETVLRKFASAPQPPRPIGDA